MTAGLRDRVNRGFRGRQGNRGLSAHSDAGADPLRSWPAGARATGGRHRMLTEQEQAGAELFIDDSR
ncbi:MAG: hypothetical protein R3E68_04300 [Burkholderiaceae bacterium]